MSGSRAKALRREGEEAAVFAVDGNFRDRIEEDYKQLKVCLSDRHWRLNNLYWIINERGQRVKFQMKPTQANFYRDLWYRNVILKARQLGFTTLIDIFGLDFILFNNDVTGQIIAHNLKDAGKIFRTKIKFPYQALPQAILAERYYTKCDAGELILSNNSSMSVGTSGRSGTLQFLHISEHGKICARTPEKAREIKTGSMPAVHEGSWFFDESTAEGQSGDFYDICETAKRAKEAGTPLNPLSIKFHFYPWHENPEYRLDPRGIVIPDRLATYFDELEAKLSIALDAGQRAWYTQIECGAFGLGEDMKREHPSFPEEAFQQAIEGAYYKRQMDKVYEEGRVCSVPVNPDYPVHTHWDIGHSDSTVIWFFQDIAGWRRYVDHYENCGEGLEHYVGELKARGYRYGRFIGPHDIGVHEWTSGQTRRDIALNKYGILFEAAPNIGLLEGIEATRHYLAKCVFDEAKCSEGVDHLSNYRKEWDAKRGTYKSMPLHDEHSHSADAFRMGSVSDGTQETLNAPSTAGSSGAVDEPFFGG